MKINYRPEVDGLRGIAIIFIILGHLNSLDFVTGGVNFFFVISGYLITHIVLKSDLKVLNFYKTRFNKLYPSIFIISIITILLFFLIGDLVNWSIIFRSFITTLIGVFNFYLIILGDVYGQSRYLNPFLHFWALCVIIQFYLTFPFILKIIFFIKRKINLGYGFVFFILFLFSLILFFCSFFYKNSFLFDFYSPLGRYWQFLLGSCLYFFFIFKNKYFFENFAIYLAVILFLMWQLDLEIFYNWRYTQILLTVSALLFLYSKQMNFINKILSIQPLRYLGKISFEIYIIHMPIIYFISTWFDAGASLISIILIVLFGYYFFELKKQNFYLKIYSLFFNKTSILFSIFLLVSLISIYIYDKKIILTKEENFKNFISKINPREIKNNHEMFDYLKGNKFPSCFDIKPNLKYLDNCSFIKDKNKKNVILVGSSVVSTLGYDLKNRLKDFNYYHFGFSGYVYLPNFNKINLKNNKIDPEFNQQNSFVRSIILSRKLETFVIIGARFPRILNKTRFNNLEGGIEGGDWNYSFKSLNNLNIDFETGFKNSIQELSNKNIKVILIYPIPEVGFDIDERLKNRKFFSNVKYDTSFEVYKRRTKSSFELLDSIRGENIFRVYPHKFFCDSEIKNRCITHQNKKILYSDSYHPSYRGTKHINDLIIKKILEIN